MAKVLIDIPKEWRKCKISFVKDCIGNGITLDRLTNGEVIQMLFPNTELHWTNEYEYGLRPLDSNWIIWFKGDWWNRKWGE